MVWYSTNCEERNWCDVKVGVVLHFNDTPNAIFPCVNLIKKESTKMSFYPNYVSFKVFIVEQNVSYNLNVILN